MVSLHLICTMNGLLEKLNWGVALQSLEIPTGVVKNATIDGSENRHSYSRSVGRFPKSSRMPQSISITLKAGQYCQMIASRD